MCYIRKTADISRFSDFEEVVGCIDYCGVDSWPDSLYEYVHNHISAVKKWCVCQPNMIILVTEYYI